MNLTREEVRAAAREVVERSTRAQGLPLRVADPKVLEKVAALVRADDGGSQKAA